MVTSLDPASGKKLWEHQGSTIECVSSIVTDGKHLFTSGGYDKNHVAAMLADGTGEVVWEYTTTPQYPYVHCFSRACLPSSCLPKPARRNHLRVGQIPDSIDQSNPLLTDSITIASDSIGQSNRQ